MDRSGPLQPWLLYSTLTLVQLVLLHDVVLHLGAHFLFLLLE